MERESMKQDEIEVGEVYTAKISRQIAMVVVTEDLGVRYNAFIGQNQHAGWEALNLDTKRKVLIRNASQFRARIKGGVLLLWWGGSGS